MIPLAGKFKVGKPMPVRVEMKNISSGVIEYDSQGFGINDSFLVTHGDGAEVPHVGGSAQTTGGGRPLEPGETVELADFVDLAAEYLVAKPGSYRVQSRSRGAAFGNVAFPASNVLEFKVARGKLNPAQSVAARLISVLPDDTWEVEVSGTENLYLVCNQTGLKADLLYLEMVLKEGNLEGDDAAEFERVGSIHGRNIFWSETPSPEIIDGVWPDHRKAIFETIDLKNF